MRLEWITTAPCLKCHKRQVPTKIVEGDGMWGSFSIYCAECLAERFGCRTESAIGKECGHEQA